LPGPQRSTRNAAAHSAPVPVLRLGDVSTAANDSDHDACPNCRARVESAISAPGEPVREATERRCPSCGKVLRREIGGEWTIDESAS